MEKFRIRSSAIGRLMSGDIGLSKSEELKLNGLYEKEKVNISKGKPNLTDLQKKEKLKLEQKRDNPELPKGVKTFLIDWKKEQLYQRRKTFTSKYTSKGNQTEDDAIDYIAEQMSFGFLKKNEKYYGDDQYITGTPDVVTPKIIIDNKSSWDCFTFPLYETKEDLNMDYWWQGQGYMYLTGVPKYALCYCLMDMPEDLIRKEVLREMYKIENLGKSYDMMYREMEMQFRYSGLPDELRFKKFEFDYEPDAIEKVKERVLMARKFIKTLKIDAEGEIVYLKSEAA